MCCILFSAFQNSSANISYSKGIDSVSNRFVSATLNIQNGTDLKTFVEVRGFPGIKSDHFDAMFHILGRKLFKPRSYALICANTKSNKVKLLQRSRHWGKRLPNDLLLRLETKRVTASIGKIPKHTFQYDDTKININYVELNVNVSYHAFAADTQQFLYLLFFTYCIVFSTCKMFVVLGNRTVTIGYRFQ